MVISGKVKCLNAHICWLLTVIRQISGTSEPEESNMGKELRIQTIITCPNMVQQLFLAANYSQHSSDCSFVLLHVTSAMIGSSTLGAVLV